MARGSTIQYIPAAWEGSTTMGRWLILRMAGMADRSRVLRVKVSKVRTPRSHKITFSLPAAMIYSADMIHSS